MVLSRLFCLRAFLFTNYIYYLLHYLLTISLINLPSISKQFANVCSKYPAKDCLHAHKIPRQCYFTWKIWRSFYFKILFRAATFKSCRCYPVCKIIRRSISLEAMTIQELNERPQTFTCFMHRCVGWHRN